MEEPSSLPEEVQQIHILKGYYKQCCHELSAQCEGNHQVQH